MKKEVRLFCEKDIDFIYDSLRDDLDEQGVLHRFKYSREEFKDLLLSETPPAIFLILWIDGKRSGFANYSIDHRNFTANYLSNLYINDLFVIKKCRRMGGGSLLLSKLKEIAKEKLCGRIEFFVLADNIDAIKFYEKTLKSKIISDGLHYMRLELDY